MMKTLKLSVVTYNALPFIVTAVDDRLHLLTLERVEDENHAPTYLHRTVYNVPAGSVEVLRERAVAA